MRCVFMGTPQFAVPALEALHRGHDVGLVITQPDRPAGRGRNIAAPPVKIKALELGLPVSQPPRVKRPEVLETLARVAPEVIVVVGYGQLIPQTIIDLPRYGCVNVHASLLPHYRGAAPINWAIVNGETVTGVTTMLIERRLDAGDMLMKRETPIGPDERAPQVADRLSKIGAELLIETLAGLERGTVTAVQQDEAQASYASILKREDGLIQWDLTSLQIFNRIRGFDPWPGAYTVFRGKRLHIRSAEPLTGVALEPGVISLRGGGFAVGCGERTALSVQQVQLEGKKTVAARDFVHGYRPRDGERLGESTT